jgi:hypothetical protein
MLGWAPKSGCIRSGRSWVFCRLLLAQPRGWRSQQVPAGAGLSGGERPTHPARGWAETLAVFRRVPSWPTFFLKLDFSAPN